MYITARKLSNAALPVVIGVAEFISKGKKERKGIAPIPNGFVLPKHSIIEKKLGIQIRDIDGEMKQVFSTDFAFVFDTADKLVALKLARAYMLLGYSPPLQIARIVSSFLPLDIQNTKMGTTTLVNVLAGCARTFDVSMQASQGAKRKLLILRGAARSEQPCQSEK